MIGVAVGLTGKLYKGLRRRESIFFPLPLEPHRHSREDGNPSSPYHTLRPSLPPCPPLSPAKAGVHLSPITPYTHLILRRGDPCGRPALSSLLPLKRIVIPVQTGIHPLFSLQSFSFPPERGSPSPICHSEEAPRRRIWWGRVVFLPSYLFPLDGDLCITLNPSLFSPLPSWERREEGDWGGGGAY